MFNWINSREISFNSFLLMDRWLIKMILDNQHVEFCTNMGIALTNNPAVAWYFVNLCPECEKFVNQLLSKAPKGLSSEQIRLAEEYVIDYTDTSIVYVWPEIMNSNCPYIREWDSERLLSMIDFTDKVVLDVGSGTGRLAFAAATKAKIVYASEPVDRLREFIRDKIKRETITNMVVIDGTIETIPYPDNTFDIVMSAHVVGDDYESEISELTRVTKPNGYIIDCMGEDDRKRANPDQEMLKAGFEYSYYRSKTDGDVYRYIKQIIK
jgi:SAM-dependent methyltransferase